MAEEKVKEVKGPGGRRPRGMPHEKVKNPGKLMKRTVGYAFQMYPWQMVLDVICIFTAVIANVQGTLFTKTLIDAYITPLKEAADAGQTPDYTAHQLDERHDVIVRSNSGSASVSVSPLDYVHGAIGAGCDSNTRNAAAAIYYYYQAAQAYQAAH